MTREKAKQLLPIIQAYAEGKTIQTKRLDGTWVDFEPKISKDIGINFENGEHRIKPEENYTIKQNTVENWIEGGVVSISGSVDTFRCWKCGRTLPISERTNFVYASNPPKYSCKECEGIKKEKHYRPFKNCDELCKYWHDEKVRMSTFNNSKSLIWVKNKEYGTDNLITTFDDSRVYTSIYGWINMKELFDNFTFLDGSPYGKEVS